MIHSRLSLNRYDIYGHDVLRDSINSAYTGLMIYTSKPTNTPTHLHTPPQTSLKQGPLKVDSRDLQAGEKASRNANAVTCMLTRPPPPPSFHPKGKIKQAVRPDNAMQRVIQLPVMLGKKKTPDYAGG